MVWLYILKSIIMSFTGSNFTEIYYIISIFKIGIPHDKFGEVPRAYIVANQNEVLEEEIHQFLDEKVTDFKKLRGGIEFVGQIPKSPSGKILRRELRDALKSK